MKLAKWTSIALALLAVVRAGADEPPKNKKDPQSAIEPRSAPGAGQKFLEKGHPGILDRRLVAGMDLPFLFINDLNDHFNLIAHAQEVLRLGFDLFRPRNFRVGDQRPKAGFKLDRGAELHKLDDPRLRAAANRMLLPRALPGIGLICRCPSVKK